MSANDSYLLRTQAILLAIFFHYVGYVIILFVEAVRSSTKITYFPGISILIIYLIT